MSPSSKSNQGSSMLPIFTVIILGILALVAYYATQSPAPKKSQKPTAQKQTQKQAKNHFDDSFRGSGTRRRQRRNQIKKALLQKSKPAQTKKNSDAGNAKETRRSEHQFAEKNLKESKPEKNRQAWLRGKVVAIPNKTPVTSFTIKYAKVKRQQLQGRRFAKSLTFPKDSSLRTISVKHPQGLFELKVERGRYLLKITANGFQDSTLVRAYGRLSTRFRRTHSLLKKGDGSISGIVLSENGQKPINGARIALQPSGGSRYGWRRLLYARRASTSSKFAITKVDGSFTIKSLPAGKYGMTIQASGHLPQTKRGIELAISDHQNAGNIILKAGTGVIFGTILGPNNKPLKRAFVNASLISNSRRRSRTMARTDASGNYTLNDLSPGKIRLFISAGWGASALRDFKTINLSKGQKLRVDFKLGQGGLLLKGKVTDAKGDPLVKAKIRVRAWIRKPRSLSSGTALTNAKGEYQIVGLKAAHHSITVEYKGKRSHGGVADVSEKENTHNVRLEGGGIELTFIDKSTGKAPKKRIYASLTWRTDKAHRISQYSRGGSPIIFSNLPGETISLRVYSSGYSAVTKNDLQAPSPPQKLKLKITLTPAGKFKLTVKSNDGSDIPRPMIYTTQGDRRTWVMSHPTAGGDLMLTGLSPGTNSILIRARGYKSLQVTINVPTKKTGEATFTLEAKESKPVPSPKP